MVMIAIATILFVVFLEISGQLFLTKMGINNYSLGLGTGLVLLMAYCYVATSIFTALNCSFWLVAVIYLVYIVLVLFIIIKNINKIKYKFKILDWLIVVLISSILLYYSSKTTLGSLDAFDTTFYLNMITGNIKLTEMNSINALYGGTGGVYHDYVFQSYYYFAAVVSFFTTKIINLFSQINYSTTVIWFFQIIYFVFFSSLLVNSFGRIKKDNYLSKIFLLVIYVFFYGKLYYNNVFGFYGNTFRTIAIGYAILALNDLFKENNRNNWFILIIYLTGSCAFSSTSVFEVIFIIFGSFFILIDKEDNYFKYISVILFFPLINLLYISIYTSVLISLIISALVSITLYFSNNLLIKVFRKKYAKHFTLCFVAILMLLLSYKVTHNFLDFSAFNCSLSERYDMTIDYTRISFPLNTLRDWFCLISLFLLGYALIFNHQNDLIMFFIVLILTLFNPFCCSFLNSINKVYYRAYEIIFNPFTLTLMSEMFISDKKLKYVNKVILAVVLIIFVYKIDFKNPMYWHESFIPSEDYNELYKMTNYEYEVINYIKEDVQYKGDSSPYIVTTNLLTQSYISNGRYLYCRVFKIRDNWNDAEKKLHDLFNGELVSEDLREIDLLSLIKEAGIDYLVIDKNQEYYDFEKDIYSYLYLYMNVENSEYSVYENGDYIVYYFGE